MAKLSQAKKRAHAPVEKAPKGAVAGAFLSVLAVGIITIAQGIKLDREAAEKEEKE